jgi:hypothetical protein
VLTDKPAQILNQNYVHNEMKGEVDSIVTIQLRTYYFPNKRANKQSKIAVSVPEEVIGFIFQFI